MENINLALLVSRWIHIGAAIVAIGGVTFLRFVLLPGAKRALNSNADERLREAVRARWVRLVHACIALLLLTGTFNFVMLALLPKIDPIPYHAIFGVKLLAALLVFFVSIALTGRSPGFEKMRQSSGKWLSITVALAALIVLLSGVLSQVRMTGAAKVPPATGSSEE